MTQIKINLSYTSSLYALKNSITINSYRLIYPVVKLPVDLILESYYDSIITTLEEELA